MATSDQINMIMQKARAKGLDPYAVLSVAQQEGLGGGIGDNGTSFGPWQLHVGGAFPSNVNGQSTAGWTAEKRQTWAWSPDGIEYALNRIAAVAHGLRGEAAIYQIVHRFERPANPQAEYNAAVATYRKYGAVVDAYVSPDVTTPGVTQTVTDAQGNVVSVKSGPDVPGQGIFDAFGAIADFFRAITDPDNLIRAGQLVAGAVLILLGIYLLARQVGLPSPAGAVVKSAGGPVAKAAAAAVT